MSNIGILGNPSSWQVGQPAYIPDEYKLVTPVNAIRMVRRVLRRQVDTSPPISINNSEIRWIIPSSSVVMLDFRLSAVNVTFSAAVNAPLTVSLPNWAWNMFNRFRIEQHGQYVEDRTFYNYQETFEWWMKTHHGQMQTTGNALYGGGDPATRIAKAGGWQYALPFPSTCLCKSIMPWFQLVNLAGVVSSTNLPNVTCIWNVAAPTEFLEVTGVGAITSLTWTISSMEVEYDEISVESGNTGNFLKFWHMDPSPYPRIFWRTFMTNVYPLTTSTIQNVGLDLKFKSLMYIAVTVRPTTAANDPTALDKFEYLIGPGDARFPLLDYQWDINNNQWPDRPISLIDPGDVQPYKKYLEIYQMYHARTIHEDVTSITQDMFDLHKFAAFYNANQHPFSPGLLGVVSTENSTKMITLRLNFSAPPAAGLELLVHTYYWRSWKFGAPSGTIVDW